jgi:hypothetical protein
MRITAAAKKTDSDALSRSIQYSAPELTLAAFSAN